MIELISRRIKANWHLHRCPRCKKIKREPSDTCNRSSDHVFACIECLQDIRLRFGTDLLLDIYLDQNQLNRFQQMAPDQKSTDLDQRDIDRALKQQAEAVRLAKDLPPAPERHKFPVDGDPPEKVEEKMEKLMDEATRVEEEEVIEEIKKMKEEEKI